MTHRSQWRRVALASAVALLGSVTSIPAQALGLGRITVQSALGEALRAEIDVPEINADEASSLRVGVATPDAFKAAGLEYSAAVVAIQVSLQKRTDGRSYLRLSSSRPVTEPFVDLILEARWASGRVVRDYTMLFDPPNLRQSVAPTAPVLPFSPAPAAAGIASIPSYPSAQPSAQANNQVITSPAPVAKALAAQPSKSTAAPKPASSGQQVTVKPGDTAGKLAAQSKPASISLDQMLVALLRSNPEAFIGDNVNRLKSGAVLDIPAAEDAAAISPGEASRTIVAQSKDFNDFRQKLAADVPGARVDSVKQQADGKVQAKVEDRAASSVTPDKLTLSKGAVQSKAGAEDQLAKDRQAKDASTRVAELAKNIGDLNKLAGVSPSMPPAAVSTASAAKAPGVGVGILVAPGAIAASAPASASKPAVTTAVSAVPVTLVATPTATATAVATTTTVTSTATVATSVTASAASAASTPVVVKKPMLVPPPTKPSLIDELTENTFVLPALVGLLVLLAGFGFSRYKRRNKPASVDSSFLESRLQPDSFFGASGGQRIDTREGGGGAASSSSVYSPSQLDAAGDVDPVAEADVYLAYGRDLQAEEILKEALRTHPSRVAIHAKLMEIYAKRRDLKGFEVVATKAFTVTRGNGPEWAYICEMGRDLDPSNVMYQPGGQRQLPTAGSPVQTPAMAASFGSDTIPQAMATLPEATASPVDFNLDLDFSIHGALPEARVARDFVALQPSSAPVVTFLPPSPPAPVQLKEKSLPEGVNMGFVSDTVAMKPEVNDPTDNSLSFSVKPTPATSTMLPDSGRLKFDLGSLTLDLDTPITESPTPAKPESIVTRQGSLETKFALAEEFRTLGDTNGARSLANEVVAEAQGSLKSKAQAFLNALS